MPGTVNIVLMHCCIVSQISFSFLCFFCQQMAFISMFSLNLPCSCECKSFLGTRICFHLWHSVSGFKNCQFFFFIDFGAIIIFILFPSSFGICSTLPSSSRSCAKRNSRISPSSLYTIVRPLKKT